MDKSEYQNKLSTKCPRCGCSIEHGTYHYCENVISSNTDIFNNYLYF